MCGKLHEFHAVVTPRLYASRPPTCLDDLLPQPARPHRTLLPPPPQQRRIVQAQLKRALVLDGPPRRRRHLAKALLNWHILYDMLNDIMVKLERTNIPKNHVAPHLPTVALIWRLSSIREVVFSGFQLDLFSQEERPIAYWHLTQVLDTHLICLDALLGVVNKESGPYKELQFQHQLLSALQALSTAVFLTLIPLIGFNWSQLRPTFHLRYKWAFRPEYNRIRSPVVGHPDLNELLTIYSDTLQNEACCPAGYVELAEKILLSLVESGTVGGWANSWAPDRSQFLRHLLDACEGLRGLPTSSTELLVFDRFSMNWGTGPLRWFPLVHPVGL